MYSNSAHGQRKDTYEREKESKGKPTVTKSRIHTIFKKERSCSQICGTSFRLGTVPRAFNILHTGTQRRVKESALRLSGMRLKHYFCLSLFAVTSFILSFKCLTSTCLPSSCLCGCSQSSFIPMKCAVTGSVMTGSVRGAAYCCMFKALSTA